MNYIFDYQTRRLGGARKAWMLSAVLCGFVLSVHGQNSPPASTDGKGLKDFSGVWAKPGQATEGARFSGTSNVDAPRHIVKEDASMTPEGLEKWNFNRKGVTNPNQNGRIEIDPLRWCYPTGPTRPVSSAEPWEIRHFPDMVMILFERDHWTRRIYTDGRGHPATPRITWMGHSIGKWDGDTFVIDTVYVNPRVWLDSLGHPAGDGIHIIERIRRPDKMTLQYDTTYSDPTTYTKPWTERKNFELLPEGQKVIEAVYCEEWLDVGKIRGPEKVPYKSYPAADAP